jgi:hypothetical protein
MTRLPTISPRPRTVVGRLGVEPRTQGFSDDGSGCSWIALITCAFCNYKRSSSVVIFCYLDEFCDHKVSKRSSARRDRRRFCTLGVVWCPLDLASPDHTPARGQSTVPPHAPCSSAPGLACGGPCGRSRGRHTPPTRHVWHFWWLGYPGGLPARRGQGSLRLTRSFRRPDKLPDQGP